VSQAGEVLPEGVGPLDAACSGEGWALAISGATLLDWTEERGWRRLGAEARTLVGAVAGGVAVAGPGDRIGLWQPGAGASIGWLDVPDLREIAVADERTIVVTVRGARPAGVAVCGIGPRGLALAQEAAQHHSLDLSVLLGAARAPDGAVLFVSRDHVLRLGPQDGEVRVAADLRWPAGFGSASGSVSVGQRLGQAAAPGQAGAVIDLRTGQVVPAPLPGPRGRVLERLWRAYLTDGRSPAERLLDFLARFDPPLRAFDEALDVVLGNGEPRAIVGRTGIRFPAHAAKVRRPRPRPIHDQAPWRLWLDPRAVLPAAIDAYLGPGGSPALLEALLTVAGDRLPGLAVRRARGRREPLDAGNVRGLFARFGAAAAPRVLSALKHQDPQVALLGVYAAGERTMGAVLRAGPTGSAFDPLIRRRLRSRNGEHRCAALDVVGRLAMPGFAAAVEDALGHADRLVRTAAASAAATLPDPPPGLEATLARVAGEDAAEAVRLEAVRALAARPEGAGNAALLAALGDPSAAVRLLARDALAPRVSAFGRERLHETLDRLLLVRLAHRETSAARLDLAFAPSGGLAASVCRTLTHQLLGVPVEKGTLGLFSAPGERRRLGQAPLVLEIVTAVLLPDPQDEFGGLGGQGRAIANFRPHRGDALLSADQIERLYSKDPPVLARLLAEAAVRAEALDPALADRLAVLSLLGAETPADADARPGSLAARLRAASRPAALTRCRERARTLAGAADPLGLLAAWVLAAHGGPGTLDRLEARVLGDDLDRFPLAAIGLAARLGRARVPDLVGRLVAGGPAPAAKRLLVAREIGRLFGLAETALPADRRPRVVRAAKKGGSG
jgi:hypothetical protein